MTYLELCQMLVRECGITGSDNKPTTVVGQKGEMRLVVDWIARADITIQKLWSDWKFMRGTADITVPALSQFITSQAINWPADLGHWNRDESFWANVNTTDAKKISFIKWHEYRALGNGVLIPTDSAPSLITIKDDQTLAVHNPCKSAWALQAEYFRKPTKMLNDTDVSPIPEQFHDIIIYRAMMYYADYENAGEVKASAVQQYSEEMQALEAYSLPEAFRKNTFFDEEGVVVVPQ